MSALGPGCLTISAAIDVNQLVACIVNSSRYVNIAFDSASVAAITTVNGIIDSGIGTVVFYVSFMDITSSIVSAAKTSAEECVHMNGRLLRHVDRSDGNNTAIQ